jgi:hypothetical protein
MVHQHRLCLCHLGAAHLGFSSPAGRNVRSASTWCTHPLAGLGLRLIVVVGVIGAAIVHDPAGSAIVDTVRLGDRSSSTTPSGWRRSRGACWGSRAAAHRRGDRGGGVGQGGGSARSRSRPCFLRCSARRVRRAVLRTEFRAV